MHTDKNLHYLAYKTLGSAPKLPSGAQKASTKVQPKYGFERSYAGGRFWMNTRESQRSTATSMQPAAATDDATNDTPVMLTTRSFASRGLFAGATIMEKDIHPAFPASAT